MVYVIRLIITQKWLFVDIVLIMDNGASLTQFRHPEWSAGASEWVL